MGGSGFYAASGPPPDLGSRSCARAKNATGTVTAFLITGSVHQQNLSQLFADVHLLLSSEPVIFRMIRWRSNITSQL
jgi:hypothetical protein